MTKYQQFLESICVIPEDSFNEVINSLPEVDIDLIDFELDEADSLDNIAEQIITYILQDWAFVYIENVDFENKKFSLEDVDSLEELEEIKNTFTKCNITHKEDIVKQLKNEEKESEEDKEFESLLNKIRYKANIEQLKKFINSL